MDSVNIGHNRIAVETPSRAKRLMASKHKPEPQDTEASVRDTIQHSFDPNEDRYESAIDEAIAASDNDIHGALRALLIANELLEAEVARLRRQQQRTLRVPERKAKAA